jgi:SAM-dependent methyltransferase
MKLDVTTEINHDRFQAKLLQYTRKAYRMLPTLENLIILDIGCSTGVVTLELARLSSGRVVGLDTDQDALEKLNQKIAEAGLVDRVKTISGSIQDMEFTDEVFDIIWSEGVIHVIGFEEGLRKWRRLIKPDGFLVIHDRIADIEKNEELIKTCGYTLINHFIVSKEAWWDDYYRPLESMIEGLRHKYQNDPAALAFLDKEQAEVDKFKNNLEYRGSAFYVMQKKEEKVA